MEKDFEVGKKDYWVSCLTHFQLRLSLIELFYSAASCMIFIVMQVFLSLEMQIRP